MRSEGVHTERWMWKAKGVGRRELGAKRGESRREVCIRGEREGERGE